MTNEDLIINAVIDTAIDICGDHFSYIYIRSSEGFKAFKEYHLGKGFFASSISLLALLNFLSKIFYILNKGEEVLTTSSELEKYTETKKQLKIKFKETDLSFSDLEKYLKPPKLYGINETSAFVYLIKNCSIDFGIDKIESFENIVKYWNSYRNSLAHIGSVKINDLIVSFDYKNMDFWKAKNYMYNEGKNIKSFSNNGVGIQKCNIDALSRDCYKLANKIEELIKEKNFSNDNLELTANWLKENKAYHLNF